MTLITEIQHAAADPSIDVATLLRKCKILASRLQLQRLDDWLLWESNGYPETAPLPEYRIWNLSFKGHFAGPYGAARNFFPIPHACIPQDVLNEISTFKCRQSIGGIEDAVKQMEGEPHVGFPNLSLILGTKIMPGFNCVQAWGEYSKGHLIELVNAVRNRVLDFSLALWKEYPEAGESKATLPDESVKMQQIFNQTFYGGTNNLVGNAINSTVSFSTQQISSIDLRKVLETNGVASVDIEQLIQALSDEPKVETVGRFGPKVSEWIGKMLGKAADGSWNIALGAAGNLLASVIGKWYGISP